MATEIDIDDIVDLRPRCYGCDTNNTRLIHPSAGFNETGEFMIQCSNCGRVRTIREEHVRELLEQSGAHPVHQPTVDHGFVVIVRFRGDDLYGSVTLRHVFTDRGQAQAHADEVVATYEAQYGWAESTVAPVAIVTD